MSKVSIIGAGSVGSAIANNMVTMGLATEIVLIDVNKTKAFGEALDIYQGVSYCSPAIVRSGDYDDAAGSDIVIITSGVARKPGQDLFRHSTPCTVMGASLMSAAAARNITSRWSLRASASKPPCSLTGPQTRSVSLSALTSVFAPSCESSSSFCAFAVS